MRNLFFLLTIFFSVQLHAQIVSGIYSGTLVNDSTQKKQNYELALSEYRDKITGYAYTTFVVRDTFYYSIKRIKATRQNGMLVVEDDKMIANNFPESPARRVRQTNTIPLPVSDTIRTMNGKWQTNQTKEYYSLKGGLDLKRDADSSQSALIDHLTELGIVAPRYSAATNATPVVAVKEVKTSNKEQNDKPEKEKTKPKTTSPAVAAAAPVAIPYNQRKQNVLEQLEVTNDSLVLSFYDNGVIDGDIISVYLNGNNVISNSKLLASATKKTVHLNTFNTSDSVTLVLVAETLGTLPPNTGLLIVEDGDKRYEVRFSADLQTNAAIVFRKKK